MQGFHIEEPAIHLDISSNNPVMGLVSHEHALLSSYLKQEGLSLGSFASKLHPPHISSSSHIMSKLSSSAEEGVNHRRPDCHHGDLSSASADMNYWDINVLGNMLVPVAEKKQTLDEYACRGMPHMLAMEGNTVGDVRNVSISTDAAKVAAYVGDVNGYANKQGYENLYPDQASIAASLKDAKVDRMLGFNGFEGNGADLAEDSTAAFFKGSGQLSRVQEPLGFEGNHINNWHASMAALACDSLSRDDRFWRLLPSNNQKHSMDFVSCDDFCMYEFKVRRCMRGRSHDWTECPFAHPGEKARRRDPRCFHYSGTACPDFRRGACRKGDLCEFSHGVFECWLHPARFRTQLCKDGKACKRRVCFFAHSASQLRILSPEKNGRVSLQVPFTSATNDLSSYCDGPHKQTTLLTRQASPAGNGRGNGYGGDEFFETFSPKSMHRLSRDGIEDEVHPTSAHRNTFNQSERGPLDGDLGSYSLKHSYGHHGGSFKELPNMFEHNSAQEHTHRYFHALVGDESRFVSGTINSHRPTDSTSSSLLDSPSLKADADFKSQLALASFKGSLDQIMSPTSTLIGNIFSPPPLSPPLSPSASPPISSGVALSAWSTTLSRKKASCSAQPLPYDAFTQSSISGVDATHQSIFANLPNSSYGLSTYASTRGPSPLSATIKGDQRHDHHDGSPLSATIKGNQRHDYLDGLHAMQPAMGIQHEGVQGAPMDAMAQLVTTLQQMELRRTMDMNSKKRSLLQRMDSPKSILELGHGERWAANGFASSQGYESAQEFRSKLNGHHAKEEIENPDFGWVNELVK